METFFSVSAQTWLFLWACVIGAVLGLVYDMFRGLRIIIRHNKTAVFTEDVIFTVFFALTLFVYATERARGELRFFMFLGAFLGFLLYTLTVGLVVVTIIRKVVTFLYGIVRAIYKVISVPAKKVFSFIAQKIRSVFVYIFLTLKKLLCKTNKSLKKTKHMVYNKHNNKKIASKRSVKKNAKIKASKNQTKKASRI